MKLDFNKVREEASGRWLGIFRGLGIEVDETGRHSKCPSCGGKDRFRVDRDFAERGSYYCSGCNPGDGFDLVMKVLSVDITGAMEAVAGIVGGCEKGTIPKESNMTPELMRSIFVSSYQVRENDPVWKYLTGRGLKEIPSCLRYHPKCWESETKQNQKAMLAVFTGADGTAITMHRTFLDSDSNKLDVESPKKILPALQRMTGGAVRLYPLEGEVLGIAEGIETAIAASEDLGVPVWAATTAQLLETFQPPPQVKILIIVADNDKNFAGQKASFILANRAVVQHKMSVNVYVPPKQGEDWLDVYLCGKTSQTAATIQ